MNYTNFTSKEFNRLLDNAFLEYRRRLGKRPTFNSVKSKVDGGVDFNVLKLIAFTLLILVIVFTGAKAALGAVPVAESMYDSLLHNFSANYLLVPDKKFFVAIMQAVFVLLSELGLVYFVLLSKNVHFKTHKLHSNSIMNFLLNVVTFRSLYNVLPLVMVWGTIVFVFQISSHGDGTIIDKYLPLIMGIALSYVVEETLNERNEWLGLVRKRLKIEQDTYDSRLVNYKQDNEYLDIVANMIREQLPKIVRNNKLVNAHLEGLSPNDLNNIIKEVYTLNTSHSVLYVEKETPATDKARAWTVEEVLRDIRVRGLTKEILNSRSPKRALTKYYRGINPQQKTEVLERLGG